jgi:hypothetical protein
MKLQQLKSEFELRNAMMSGQASLLLLVKLYFTAVFGEVDFARL